MFYPNTLSITKTKINNTISEDIVGLKVKNFFKNVWILTSLAETFVINTSET